MNLSSFKYAQPGDDEERRINKTLDKLAHELPRLSAALEKLQHQDLTIHDGGETHKATTTPAPAAAR